MSDMIEQVARAMRRNKFVRTRRTVFDETIPPTENEMDDARAAIEAMREPTDEMCMAGFEDASFSNRGIWKSMIDAALSQATPFTQIERKSAGGVA